MEWIGALQSGTPCCDAKDAKASIKRSVSGWWPGSPIGDPSNHAPRLTEHGLSAETVSNILEPDCPGLDEVDRLVRDYAVQVTEKPQFMRDAIFEELGKHFTEEEIVELTLRIALCGFFNRFNDALMIGMEDGVIEDMLSAGGKIEDLPEHEADAAE